MHHGHHIRSAAVDLAVDESLQVNRRSARRDRSPVAIEHQDVLRGDKGWRHASGEQEPIGPGGIAHADMPEPIHHALIEQDVVGVDQFRDHRRGRLGCIVGHGGSPSPSLMVVLARDSMEPYDVAQDSAIIPCGTAMASTATRAASERVVDVSALIEARPIGPAQWTVIGLCALVAMLDGMDLQSIGLAAPAMIAQLHIAPPVFGYVFSAALAGLALGAFLLGPLADRVGRKRVRVAATFCFGLFTLTTALVGDLPELLACRFLAGVGLGGAMPSFISLASEYVPKPRRATIVSLLWAGSSPLGGVVGGILGSRIIPRAYGWPSIFIVGGVLPMLLSAVLALALPESVSFLVAAGKPADRIGRTLRRIFRDVSTAGEVRFEFSSLAAPCEEVCVLFRSGRAAATLLLWVSFFFAFMILVTNSSWSPILLRRVGIAPEQSALALALYEFPLIVRVQGRPACC